MAQNKHTAGDATREVFSNIAFGLTAQLLLILFGLTVAIAIRHGTPQPSDLFRILLASAVPYLFLAGQVMIKAGGFRIPIVKDQTLLHHTIQPEGLTDRAKNYHLVPVHTAVDTLDNLPLPYLNEFIDAIPVRGWSARQWVNKYRFKDGFLCDLPTWQRCCQVLEKGGLLLNRGPRKKGQMRTTDPFTIKLHLRLHQLPD